MGNDSDDLLRKTHVRRYLRIPLMHKIAKYYRNQSVEFEIDTRGACQRREDLVEWLVSRWT